MDLVEFSSSKSNDAMFLHILIFIYGHSIVENIKNNAVKVNKKDIKMIYNYCYMNYGLKETFEEFLNAITNKEEKVINFLDKKLSLKINMECE